MHKWAFEEQPAADRGERQAHKSYAFTCVRNPYTRILSSFFDKICGIQRNGKRYRGNLVPLLVQKYGIEVGDPDGSEFEFDQIRSFRRFLLFARDTIRWRRPMDPDIHWSAMSGHVSTFIVNGGRYDHIFWTEDFNAGMQRCSTISRRRTRSTSQDPAVQRKRGPRAEARAPGRGLFRRPVDASGLRDLQARFPALPLFKIRFRQPGQQMPLGEIDLDEVHFEAAAAWNGWARLQPYVELRSVRYPDAATSDYDAFFVGLAYQNAHSAAWSSFGDASIGWGELDASGADIDFHDVSLGVTYRPSREAFYRLTLSMGSEDTATRQEDQHGLRFDYGRDFDGPAAMPGADWRAGAFASVDWLDITDTGVARDETVTATGLSLRAYLNDDVYVETRGTHLARDGGTNADETVFSMQLGLEF
jgi:hypothetical protein